MLPNACRFAGRDPTEYLMKNLTNQGHSFSAPAEREIVWDVTENLYYIGLEYDTEHKSTFKEKTCELPDGNIFTLFVFTR